MIAKEYLKQAYKIEAKINADMEHIDRLRELAKKATTSISAERISGTSKHSRIEDCICRIVELQDDIKSEILHLINVKRNIQKIIENVHNRDLNVLLTLRYINYETWYEISKKLNYSERWIHKLHATALITVDEILKST